MKFGICVPNYGDTLDIEGLKRIALTCEELGFDSIWLTDHLLMPRNSGTPYENILEPITTMSYFAGLTKEVKLGISSLVIAMRNPVVVAKEIATIDVLSNGRVVLAIATGWNEKEFDFLGADFHRRGKIVNESIEIMQSLWEGKISYKGKFIKQYYEDAELRPRPKQERIPIWIAGNSEHAMRRAIKYGDAWHPNAYPPEDFQKLVQKYKSISETFKPIRIRIAIDIKSDKNYYISPLGERRILLTANMEENKKILEKFESMGVDYALITTNPKGISSIEDQLKAIEMFSKKFI